MLEIILKIHFKALFCFSMFIQLQKSLKICNISDCFIVQYNTNSYIFRLANICIFADKQSLAYLRIHKFFFLNYEHFKLYTLKIFES